MPITHTKVSTVADGSTTDHVRPSDWNADHTFTRPLTLQAGSSSTAPLVIPAGTLTTIASSGAIETDNDCLYYSAQSSARQVVVTEQVITQTSPFTGTTLLTITKLFDASTGLNGAVTVGPSKTYMFECNFNLTASSTITHTKSFGFGGTATIDRQGWTAITKIAAASSVPTAPVVAYCTAAGSNTIHATSTLANCQSFITGKVVIGTSGTIIPGIVRSAGTAALVVSADSYFRIWPLGSTSFTRVGHWS
jgi:hypothetical protein